MFGFLNPLVWTERYRRVHARCVANHRSRYGNRSLPFVSYESVFLYTCWMDATATQPDDLARNDRDIGDLCSAATLVLAQTKVEDEIRDSGSIAGRAITWLLRDGFARARDYFSRFDPRFNEAVASLIAEHLALEESRAQVTLDEYARSTVECFAHVFRLISCLPGVSESPATFGVIGGRVAAALIACDSILDVEKDRRAGIFNPLQPEELAAACTYADEALTAARRIADEAFGAGGIAAETLSGVQARMALRLDNFRSGTARPKRRILDEIARVIRSPVTSHIDASTWSERRDKLFVFSGVVAGALCDRVRLR